MDKNVNNFIEITQNLKKKGLMYLDDHINLKSQLNYQFLVGIIENVNLIMEIQKYEEIKHNKEEVVNQLALLILNKEQLISDSQIEFMENIIMEYIDIEKPVIILNECLFVIKPNLLQKRHQNTLIQKDEKNFQM